MKIKSKLLAGGLMTAISCALVGSITGTFAWYQYSNSHTASMHGVSVGVSQNLQLKLSNESDWTNGNLDWSRIQLAVDQDQLGAEKNDGSKDFKLAPVSNGAIGSGTTAGKAALNGTWYGNPDGSQDKLPVVTTGFMQFTFYARIAETDGTLDDQDHLVYTYPQGTLFVTDIAGQIANSNSSKLANALRMHVNFGDTSYFVVNPVNSANDSVLLKATYSQSRQYDWEDAASSTDIIYRLPTTATTDDATGSLVSLAHSDVIADNTGTDGALESDISGAIPGTAAGLKVVVTLWLEGFEVAEGQATGADDSQWWDIEATIGQEIKAGFELTGVKANS